MHKKTKTLGMIDYQMIETSALMDSCCLQTPHIEYQWILVLDIMTL